MSISREHRCRYPITHTPDLGAPPPEHIRSPWPATVVAASAVICALLLALLTGVPLYVTIRANVRWRRRQP